MTIPSPDFEFLAPHDLGLISSKATGYMLDTIYTETELLYYSFVLHKNLIKELLTQTCTHNYADFLIKTFLFVSEKTSASDLVAEDSQFPSYGK